MDGITKSKVFTISSSQSFVDVLATGILERVGNDPCALTVVKVLLPTRHASRSLREAFLRLSGGDPVLLPLMGSLGDIDEDEFNYNDSLSLGEEFSTDFIQGIAPAISLVRRELLLGRLIMARGNIEVDQAIQLARELARLIDQMHTEGCSLDNLLNLVPNEYAIYWQQVLDFLKIITVQWPEVLKEEGVLDPADRRNRLLNGLAAKWQKSPPTTPVYAAGSTGSIPATARLLSVISRLPNGAVILPGVDCYLSELSWRKLEPHHPQYGLAHLLQYLGVLRKTICDWSLGSKIIKETPREKLIKSSFNTSLKNLNRQAEEKINLDFFKNFKRIDCPTPREEAGVIALAMRERLETTMETAALITPDRALARRVAAELKRWNIEINDSAGISLSETSTGTFLKLIIVMVAEKFSPVSLLAALKHPLARGGMKNIEFSRLVRKLEILILRGPRLRIGLDVLCKKLEKQTDKYLELRQK